MYPTLPTIPEKTSPSPPHPDQPARGPPSSPTHQPHIPSSQQEEKSSPPPPSQHTHNSPCANPYTHQKKPPPKHVSNKNRKPTFSGARGACPFPLTSFRSKRRKKKKVENQKSPSLPLNLPLTNPLARRRVRSYPPPLPTSKPQKSFSPYRVALLLKPPQKKHRVKNRVHARKKG